MTNATGIPVRLISYGNGDTNTVGLNPVSGALMDVTPSQRELWATWTVNRNSSYGATYGETVTEYSAPVGAHDGTRQQVIDVPAHEDIFATDVFDAIVDDDDILIDVDPVFVGMSHPNLIR